MSDVFVPPVPLQTAILFLVFNRPDTTKQVFEVIRQAKPPRLYVAADGARPGREGEALRVELVRQISTAVDWPCEVRTLFRDKNLGCKMAVSGGIDWFFENEEQGIILEDDCMPSQSFFWFCQEMLQVHRDDINVMSICGTNISPSDEVFKGSYFYSKYALMWGWASWRRAWLNYDRDLESWPEFKRSKRLTKDVGLKSMERIYWEKILDQTKEGEIDTWDYQWIYSCWRSGASTVAPSKNLIRNLGFSADATHTKDASPFFRSLVHQELAFPLDHKIDLVMHQQADEFLSKMWFGVNWITFLKAFIFRSVFIRKINSLRRKLKNV